MKTALLCLTATAGLALSACNPSDSSGYPEGQPALPAQPAQPAQQVQPALPAQPAQPAQAAQPAMPATPAQPAQPAQPAVPVSRSLTAEGQPIEDPITCHEELGDPAARRLVQRCIAVSPATRPPCNVANPCQMIQDEIKRGCDFFGPNEKPAECAA